MRREYILISIFVIGALCASSVKAQPSEVEFRYYDDLQGEPELPIVNELGQPIPDGTPICVMQDLGSPGPDVFDVVIDCFASNGEAAGYGDGYFTQESPIFVYGQSRLYLKIAAGQRCWMTISYEVGPASIEIQIAGDEWTMLEEECGLPARISLDYAYGMPPENPWLVCPCDSETPLPDGSPFCVFHDWDADGIDSEDTVLICGSIDGPNGILVMFNIADASGGAVFYVRANTINCCWTTSMFTVEEGFHQIHIAWEDWTCANETCPPGVVLPSAPINVQATDDTLCMSVQVTWEHDGQHVAGFEIFQNAVPALTVLGEAVRAALLPVQMVQQYSYSVAAFGATGQSAQSNSDLGSSFRTKFAEGAAGDVQGKHLAGSEFTLQFDLPVQSPEECPSIAALELLSNGVSQGLLCFDSLVTEMTCHFPDVTGDTLTNCRIVLASFDLNDENGHGNTDTTESVFTLIPLSAPSPTELPREFGITSVYPNPFNSEAQIEFTLPREGVISVDIYNVSGQHVTTLANDRYAAGTHAVRWDARSASSGVYLCRAVSSEMTMTRKLLLLR